MSEVNILEWFYDNPWVIFIGAVGLIVMTFLAFRDAIKDIFNFIQKPKLVLKTQIESVIHKDNPNSTVVNFWVYVENHGKTTSDQTRCMVKFLDKTGTKEIVSKLSKLSPKTSFNLLWHEGEETRESLDIMVNGNYGLLKIPFRFTIGKPLKSLEEGDSFSGVTSSFESPVKKLDLNTLLGAPVDPNYLQNFRVELTVIYNGNKTKRKQFLIQSHWHIDEYGNSRAYLNEIKFESVDD